MATVQQQPASIADLQSPSRTFAAPTAGPSWRRGGAAFLSMLIPGLGQLALGQRRRGLVMLAISGCAIAIIWMSRPADSLEALATFSQPRNLIWLLLADAALLLFRLYAVIDAYRMGASWPTIRPLRTASTFVLAALLLITTVPHLIVGYYDIVTYQFLDNVFSDQARRPAPAPEDVELTFPVNLKEDAQPVVLPTRVDESE